jgi:hypothetical protein
LIRCENFEDANIKKGSDVDVIYMDFQKAFDKVPHKRLIRKATNYMLDNPLLEWIEDFLTGRTLFR